MNQFKPFSNSTASKEGHGLTMENGIDRVTVYGDLSITRDREGLAKTRMLLDMLTQAEQVLSSDHALPDKVADEPRPEDAPTVANPFG